MVPWYLTQNPLEDVALKFRLFYGAHLPRARSPLQIWHDRHGKGSRASHGRALVILMITANAIAGLRCRGRLRCHGCGDDALGLDGLEIEQPARRRAHRQHDDLVRGFAAFRVALGQLGA